MADVPLGWNLYFLHSLIALPRPGDLLKYPMTSDSGFPQEIYCVGENVIPSVVFIHCSDMATMTLEPENREMSSAMDATAQCSGLILLFLSVIVLFPCSVKPDKEVAYSIFNLTA